MDKLIFVLFICISTPLFLMLPLLAKKARLVLGFVIIGMFTCLFISQINGLLLTLFEGDIFYVTTTITPITEELIKAFPIVFFSFLFTNDRKTLISISMATGIGFAVMESSFHTILNYESVTFAWVLFNSFSKGLMHGLCTTMVGIGCSFAHKKKKLFYTGTFAMLVTAITYHAIGNCIVSFAHPAFLLLPGIALYIPIIFLTVKDEII